MQSNALEKSNPNNTDMTIGLKIAVTVQKRNRAFIPESSLPTSAQSSAAAKNAIQVLEAIRKRTKNKDQTLFYHLYSQEKERGQSQGGSKVWNGVHGQGKEVTDIEALNRDVREVMRREEGTAPLWFSQPKAKEADTAIISQWN